VVNDNDLRSPAINVEKLILFLSSLRRADQFCAVIALARVEQRSQEAEIKATRFQTIDNQTIHLN
jgi:hypothetical protein